MVASLYHTRMDARFQTILRNTREAFDSNYGVAAHAVGVAANFGICMVPITPQNTIPILRRLADDGHIAIGVVAITFRNPPAEGRVLSVYFASRDQAFAAEALIDESRGWPILGEWTDCTPLDSFCEIIKEYQS